MEHTVYETGQTILQPGESIFLYTDGVTEALNTREELFSDDRLRKKITFLQARPPEEVISGVAEEIARFSNNMPQAEDIAMMMIRFRGERKGCPPFFCRTGPILFLTHGWALRSRNHPC